MSLRPEIQDKKSMESGDSTLIPPPISHTVLSLECVQMSDIADTF